MSNMNFNCDVCGREMLGCTFVHGMKFCAKCYQETFGETDKDRKIADLEAKLAKSEKERELDNSFWKQECDSLQKTLAEKDKEIESLKHFKVTIGTMETNQVDISSTTYIDQDKISFAVEQLEIARKLIDELLDNCGDKQYKVWEVFDSQIKQLNEGK